MITTTFLLNYRLVYKQNKNFTLYCNKKSKLNYKIAKTKIDLLASNTQTISIAGETLRF